jgi:uncharacterized protein YjbJ (UPF0337 family)
MVNQQVFEGHWDEIKGKLRAHWAALTDDDLEQAHGSMQELLGAIQRRTGESRDAVENYLEEIITESGISLDQGTAREYARYAADSMQQAARQMSERAQYAAQQMRDGYTSAEDMVRQRPVESLAVCFGAGLIAGVLVGLVIRR